MRNLKKILALALALVMSLSLMATAGATDFKDDESVSETYRTAVEVLSGLKVFGGDQNGQFNPDTPIRRSEVAAIIYRIATGDVGSDGHKTYSTYNQFPDVIDGDWFAGYVTYCANAGYIKGRNDGKFYPNDQVTGYEVLAMILRAVGYDKNNEFVGSNWQINTASIAQQKGVLKNVSGTVQLSQPATREVVAELLFRSILLNRVNWNANSLSYVDDTAKVCDVIGLEDISGIVMANEWADLEAGYVMTKGKTRLNVNGKAYTLDVASELTDIGELRHAYVKGSTVFTGLEDVGGNTVKDNKDLTRKGSGVTVDSLRGSVKLDGNTEYFVNFDENFRKWDESDWLLRYRIETNAAWEASHTGWVTYLKDLHTAADRQANGQPYPITIEPAYGAAVDDGVYVVSIRPNTQIPTIDLEIMKEIFATADRYAANPDPNPAPGIQNYTIGEVYAGTSSLEDLSDQYSWKQFQEKYLIAKERETFDRCGNGEWLKVVDNDGDGVAEYVFLTLFNMTTIADWNSRTEEWAFENDAFDADDNIVAASSINLIDGAELAVGDLILYTLIDGVYHVTKPAPVKMTIAAKGIDYKAETFTSTDGGVYDWSGIDHAAAAYYHDVSYATAGVTYNLYQDWFGFTRLYTEANGGFTLLTDGYYETDRRNIEVYKAEIWEGGYKDVTVLDDLRNAPAEVFIYNAIDEGNNREEGTWQRLKPFNEVYYGANLSFWGDGTQWSGRYLPNMAEYEYVTNIASTLVNGEGEYSLAVVDRHSATVNYSAYAIDVTNYNVSAQDQTLYGVTVNGNGDWFSRRIHTTTETVYYYVQNPGAKSETVTTWTGYAKAPSNFKVTKAYAVVSDPANTDLGYSRAEVVVIEGAYHEEIPNVYFAYALDQKLLGGRQTGVYSLGYDTEEKTWGDTMVPMIISNYRNNYMRTASADWPNGLDDLMNYYYADESGYAVLVDENWEYYGVFSGKVVGAERIRNIDYIVVTKDGTDYAWDPANLVYIPRDSIASYAVSYNRTNAAANNVRTTYGVWDNRSFSVGDQLIYMMDAQGNPALAINLEYSVYQDIDGLWKYVPGLKELYDRITADYYARHNHDTNAPVLVEIRENGTGNLVYSLTATEGKTVEIPYNVWSNYGKLYVRVVGAAGNTIAVTGDMFDYSTGAASVWANVGEQGAAGYVGGVVTPDKTYTVVVQSRGTNVYNDTVYTNTYSYSYIFLSAEGEAYLKRGDTTFEPNTACLEDGPEGAGLNRLPSKPLAQWVESFEIPANATATWYFKANDGRDVTVKVENNKVVSIVPADVDDTDMVTSAYYVVVTSENGDVTNNYRTTDAVLPQVTVQAAADSSFQFDATTTSVIGGEIEITIPAPNGVEGTWTLTKVDQDGDDVTASVVDGKITLTGVTGSTTLTVTWTFQATEEDLPALIVVTPEGENEDAATGKKIVDNIEFTINPAARAAAGEVEVGQQVKVSFDVLKGYYLDTIKINGVEYTGIQGGEECPDHADYNAYYILVELTGEITNVSIAATDTEPTPETKIDVTLNLTDEDGKATVEETKKSAKPGETVTFTVTVAEGYEIKDLSKNATMEPETGKGEVTITVAIPDDATEAIEVTGTVAAEGGEEGEYKVELASSVKNASISAVWDETGKNLVSFTVTPEDGYKVTGVSAVTVKKADGTTETINSLLYTVGAMDPVTGAMTVTFKAEGGQVVAGDVEVTATVAAWPPIKVTLQHDDGIVPTGVSFKVLNAEGKEITLHVGDTAPNGAKIVITAPEMYTLTLVAANVKAGSPAAAITGATTGKDTIYLPDSWTAADITVEDAFTVDSANQVTVTVTENGTPVTGSPFKVVKGALSAIKVDLSGASLTGKRVTVAEAKMGETGITAKYDATNEVLTFEGDTMVTENITVKLTTVGDIEWLDFTVDPEKGAEKYADGSNISTGSNVKFVIVKGEPADIKTLVNAGGTVALTALKTLLGLADENIKATIPTLADLDAAEAGSYLIIWNGDGTNVTSIGYAAIPTMTIKYTLTVTVTNGNVTVAEAVSGQKIAKDAALSTIADIQLKLDEGFEVYPTAVTVTMGEALTAGVDYSYDKTTGVISFANSKKTMTADMTITFAAPTAASKYLTEVTATIAAGTKDTSKYVISVEDAEGTAVTENIKYVALTAEIPEAVLADIIKDGKTVEWTTLTAADSIVEAMVNGGFAADGTTATDYTANAEVSFANTVKALLIIVTDGSSGVVSVGYVAVE